MLGAEKCHFLFAFLPQQFKGTASHISQAERKALQVSHGKDQGRGHASPWHFSKNITPVEHKYSHSRAFASTCYTEWPLKFIWFLFGFCFVWFIWFYLVFVCLVCLVFCHWQKGTVSVASARHGCSCSWALSGVEFLPLSFPATRWLAFNLPSWPKTQNFLEITFWLLCCAIVLMHCFVVVPKCFSFLQLH